MALIPLLPLLAASLACTAGDGGSKTATTGTSAATSGSGTAGSTGGSSATTPASTSSTSSSATSSTTMTLLPLLAASLACTADDGASKPSATGTNTATSETTGSSGGTSTTSSSTTATTASTASTATATTGDQAALVFDGPPPRNLLIISVDTLRRDHVGRWDPSGRSDTPFLDGLLAEGVPLEDLRSCSNWTESSFLCLYTGQSTVDLGFEPLTHDNRAPPPPKTVDSLATWLHDLGYRTVLVSGSPFLSEGAILGRAGWDVADYLARDELGQWATASDIAAQAVLRGVELMRDPKDSPFLLHVHFMDPHSPYEVPADQLEGVDGLDPLPNDYDMSDVLSIQQFQADFAKMTPEQRDNALAWLDAYYRGDVRLFDEGLAELWAALDAMGALDDTLVLFYSDHGEQFYEHGGWLHGQALFNEEGLTLGGFWARNLQPRAWTGAASHQDIVPTIFKALGLPAQPSWTGLPIDEVPADRPRFAFRYEYPKSPVSGVDVGGFHLHYDWGGQKMMFDNVADPAEATNIYDPKDPRVAELWDLLLPEIDRVLTYLDFLEPVDPGP